MLKPEFAHTAGVRLPAGRSRLLSSGLVLGLVAGVLVAASFLVPDASAQGAGSRRAYTPSGRVPGMQVFSPPRPLSQVPVPLPPTLGQYVRDFDAAVRLGKAFFWDVQVGSDGLTACASCHWQAGADGRTRSQLAPGADATRATLASGGGGINYEPSAADFPFTLRADPIHHASEVLRDTDEIHGSSGVSKRNFTGIVPGQGAELGTVVHDASSSLGGVNVDRVTGRNTPTVINAIFNTRSFWDGRADTVFNGVSHHGQRDPNARVLERNPDGSLNWTTPAIDKAALASQAVGPVLSDVEMTWIGRDFKTLARKLLPARPLKDQMVDPTDVHLGQWSASPSRGLQANLTYADMIRAAFHDRWTAHQGQVAGYSQLEHNFTLYWGLAILCYESQLVSDQTPWDRFVAGDQTAMTPQQIEGWDVFMSPQTACNRCHMAPEFAGATWGQFTIERTTERMPTFQMMSRARITLATLVGANPAFLPLTADPRGRLLEIRTPQGALVARGIVPGQAGDCTASDTESALALGPSAPVPPAGGQFESLFTADCGVLVHPGALPNGLCNIELAVDMRWGGQFTLPAGDYPVLLGGTQIAVLSMNASQGMGIYDVGYYNLGVRPTTEDLGIGANGPYGPLSIVERLKAGDPFVQHHQPVPALAPNELTIVRGAFKTPSLRNLALTGPYFHTGGAATIEQVVQFYTRGADFAETNAAELDAGIEGFPILQNSQAKQAALVAFLREALLDERVARRSGPFCTPSLPLKDGQVGNELVVANNGQGEALPRIVELPATGAAGGAPLSEFADKLRGGVLVMPSGNRILLEEGVEGCGPQAVPVDSSRVVRFALASRPAADVAIQFASSLPAQMAVEPAQLVFTPSNWFHAQTVRVRGVQDQVLDADAVATLVASATSSGDARYDQLDVADLQYTVRDSIASQTTVHVDQLAIGATLRNGTAAHPYATIGEALACVPDGYTIDVRAGTYRENLLLQGKRVVLRTQAGAILDGSLSAPVLIVQGAATSGSQLVGFVVTRGGYSSAEAGGILVRDGADLLVDACRITANSALNGGGVRAITNARAVLRATTVDNNTAFGSGGGVHADGGRIELLQGSVNDNLAFIRGGGACTSGGGSIIADGARIERNTSRRNGGGVYANGGTLRLQAARVTNNHADRRAGGIYADAGAALTLNATKVTNNTGLLVVGGLHLEGVSFDATGCTIATNGALQMYLANSITGALRNSVVWTNGAGSAIGTNIPLPSTLPVEHSLVDWNGFAAPGVLHADPRFANAATGNHAPLVGSPLVDGGDPALVDPDGTRADIGSHPLLGS